MKKTTGAGVCWREKTKRIGGRSITYKEPYACVKKVARKRPKRKPAKGMPKRKAEKSAQGKRSR